MPVMTIWDCVDCGDQVQIWEYEAKAACYTCGTIYVRPPKKSRKGRGGNDGKH